MLKSILDAIRTGDWGYEPAEVPANQFHATSALPGSDEKLDILAQRIQHGQPLWHPHDRLTYSEVDE